MPLSLVLAIKTRRPRYEAGDGVFGSLGRCRSIARVAAVLNAEGVTIRGGRIHPTTLTRVLRRQVAA